MCIQQSVSLTEMKKTGHCSRRGSLTVTVLFGAKHRKLVEEHQAEGSYEKS